MAIREQLIDTAASADIIGYRGIAKKDDNHIVVACRQSQGEGNYYISAHYTDDGGATWVENVVYNSASTGYDAYAIYEPVTGRYIIAVATSTGYIYLYYSTNGTSWTQVDTSMDGYTATSIATGDGSTYVALKRISDGACCVLGTDDGGDFTWDEVVYEAAATYNPRVACDNAGHVIFLFKTGSKIQYVLSDDYCSSFGSLTELVNNNADGWDVGSNPKFGTFLAFYETSTPEAYVKVSRDFGTTWDAAVKIADNIAYLRATTSGSELRVNYYEWDSGESYWKLKYYGSNVGVTWSGFNIEDNPTFGGGFGAHDNLITAKYADTNWYLVTLDQTQFVQLDGILILDSPFVVYDAILQQTRTKTVGLDAIVKEQSSEVFIDAQIQRFMNDNSALDAVLSKTCTTTTSLDGVAQKIGRTKTLSVDTLLAGPHYTYVGLDAEFTNVELYNDDDDAELSLDASGSGHVTRIFTGSADIALDTDGAAWNTTLMTGDVNLELDAEGYEGFRGAADLEIDASGTIIFGKTMSGSANLALQSEATALSTIIVTGSAMFAMQATGQVGVLSVTATGGSPNIAVDASGAGVVGHVMSGAADLELDTGTANTLLPGWVMTGAVSVGISQEGHMSVYNVQGTFDILVLNTETKALTTYTNFNFNSLCKFNNLYFGTKGAEIWQLTSSKDDTTDIDAYITTPTLDISQGNMRVLIDMWLMGRSSGKLITTLTWDEKYISKDVVRHLKNTVDEARVTLPRGMRGRLFKLKIENVDGSDFDLSNVRILGEGLGPKRLR